jgi:hypothetical protein
MRVIRDERAIMKSPTRSCPIASRDPVAVAIEAHLRDLEESGEDKFNCSNAGRQIDLSFGPWRACGEQYDIALVRLASAMLDDPRFGPGLMEILEGPMLAAR